MRQLGPEMHNFDKTHTPVFANDTRHKLLGALLSFKGTLNRYNYALFIFLIILVKTQMKDGAVIDVEWSVEHAILLSQT